MFSGLTNQVTSWIGANKGETQNIDDSMPPNQIEIQPASVQKQDESSAVENAEDQEKSQRSPTKSSGVFSNVKFQMSDWLGSASIPSMPSMSAMTSISSIPGLKKNEEHEEGSEQPQVDAYDPAISSNIDEDKLKNKSAEGVLDNPVTASTPTDEAGQIGQVTTKVTQGAKTFGSFLYSAVNKAGAKIKENVEHNTILNKFNKEQELFIKGKEDKSGSIQPPWIGHKSEKKIKEEILNLAQDKRNFVRPPPAGVNFDFDYDTYYPIAVTIMEEDPNVEKIRFEIVPKIITEENFWRNYFYRVSLIMKAADQGTLDSDGPIVGQGSSEDED